MAVDFSVKAKKLAGNLLEVMEFTIDGLSAEELAIAQNLLETAHKRRDSTHGDSGEVAGRYFLTSYFVTEREARNFVVAAYDAGITTKKPAEVIASLKGFFDARAEKLQR